MNTRRIVIWIVLLAAVVVTLPGQDDEAQPERAVPSGVDGWIALENVGRQEWRIVDAGGTGVNASIGSANVWLEVGGSYYFDVSTVDSEQMPLAIVDLAGDVLVSQSGADESYEPSEGADAQADSDGIEFELTEEMADRVSRFRAVTYPTMVGFVFPFAGEEEEEEEPQSDDEDGSN